MVRKDELIRIFWPLDALRSGVSGVLVGWRNSQADFFIVSLLENAHPTSVENALDSGRLLYGNKYPLEKVWRRCGKVPLQTLGLVNPKPESVDSAAAGVLILNHPYSSGLPDLHPNFAGTLNVQFIFFVRPHPVQMQFMSLKPISLALTHESDRFGLNDSRLEELDAVEAAEKARMRHLVTKLCQHTVVKLAPTAKESMLGIIINQINCCFEINALLQRNVEVVRIYTAPSYSLVDRLSNFIKTIWKFAFELLDRISRGKVYSLVQNFLVLILMSIRVGAEFILIAIESRLPRQGLSLRDISVTAQQIDLRLQQLCYWPIQYQTLRGRRKGWRSITDHHTEYIRFFNSLWLVANDVIIGVAVGTFLVQNADVLAEMLQTAIETYSTSGLRQSISWLTQNPGGLKLNGELAQFLGSLFVWIINYWAGFIHSLKPMLPRLIRIIGLASIGGATMPIAICSDVVSALTMHIHCFYLASARIYFLQLSTIVSLFHLFRGKKRNVLRNRIDSCDYELDQLLLGTVMFTLLTFLLPTVLVFYSTFAFARTVIVILKATLDTMLAALNHFPLFALMLRVKDSRRLPGGIRFELQGRSFPHREADTHFGQTTSYIYLKAIPLTVSSILQEYFRFGTRIQQHYLTMDVVFAVATGRFVPGIPRRHLYGLQYSMLPAQRVGILDLWARLGGTSSYGKAMVDGVNGNLPSSS